LRRFAGLDFPQPDEEQADELADALFDRSRFAGHRNDVVDDLDRTAQTGHHQVFLLLVVVVGDAVSVQINPARHVRQRRSLDAVLVEEWRDYTAFDNRIQFDRRSRFPLLSQ